MSVRLQTSVKLNSGFGRYNVQGPELSTLGGDYPLRVGCLFLQILSSTVFIHIAAWLKLDSHKQSSVQHEMLGIFSICGSLGR